MNNYCLYCFGKLAEGEVDFHEECRLPLTVDTVDYKSACEGYSPVAEAVALRLARATLILTKPATLVRGVDGELNLAVAKESNVEPLDKLVECLDGCEFDGSVEMIAELVEDFSSIARLDVVNLFEQVIFGWVIGCSSLSLQNFALVRPNEGVCSLAPLFDFLPSFGNATNEIAITINGKNRGVTRRDFEFAMRHMGLKDRIIRITIEKMTKAQSTWNELIMCSPLLECEREALVATISSRIKVLNR